MGGWEVGRWREVCVGKGRRQDAGCGWKFLLDGMIFELAVWEDSEDFLFSDIPSRLQA